MKQVLRKNIKTTDSRPKVIKCALPGYRLYRIGTFAKHRCGGKGAIMKKVAYGMRYIVPNAIKQANAQKTLMLVMAITVYI